MNTNKAPDKIYIPLYPNYSLDGFHLADEWMYEPHKEVENVEYIREDISNEAIQVAEDHAFFAGQEKLRESLLEWIKAQLKENANWREVNPDNRFLRGEEYTFELLITKINSL